MSEIFAREPAQISLALECAEKLPHLTSDVLWIAECASALAEPDGPEPSGPQEYVLEQVMVYCSIVRNAEASAGERFVCTLRRADGLKPIQCGLCAETPAIFEHRRAGIAVRVRYGVVHRGLGAHRAVFARNRLAAGFGGETLSIELAKIPHHFWA